MARLTRMLKALRDAAARHPTATLTAGGAVAGGLLDDEEGALAGAAAGASLGLLDATARRAGSARPANVPQSQAGIFAGFRAPGAPHDARAAAEAMAKREGLHRVRPFGAEWLAINRDIHKQTGDQFGPRSAIHFDFDNNARWEIPDAAAHELKPNAASWSGRMSSAIAHGELYQNYPEIARAIAILRPEPAPGSGETWGWFNGDLAAPTVRINKNPGARLGTGIHELQHFVDRLEGFDAGASQAMWPGDPLANQRYLGNKGEIYARAAERRRLYSEGSRANKFPMDDMGAPLADDPARPGTFRLQSAVDAGNIPLIVPSPHYPSTTRPTWYDLTDLLGD